jgi:hypothetical protein
MKQKAKKKPLLKNQRKKKQNNMDLLTLVAEQELDQIISKEYGDVKPLLEKGGSSDDDSALTTPFSRMFTYPARAIRYRKAKNVMIRYSKKIISRVEKIIRKFEGELDKSITQITKKGEDLENQLKRAKKSNDETETRAVVNQQKKFKSEVEKNQEARVQHLNQSIDNLIQAYTSGIHKRIEQPGYVLKVELSDKGQADLKFLWEEYVSKIKQQTYEKLIKIINNKHVKGLEKMIARLEIEIEDAEDRRYKSRRYRDNIAREEKETVEQKLENPESEFEKLVAYLNNELGGDGIDDEYKVALDEGGELKVYDITFAFDMDSETLEVTYYEEESETPLRKEEIKNKSDVDHVIEDIEATKKIESSEKEERQEEKLSRSLASRLELLLKNPTRDVQKKVGDELIDSYRKDPRTFAEKAIDVLLKDPDIYKEKIKAIERGISNPSLIDLLVQLREELKGGPSIDPVKELAKAEKLFTDFDDILLNQATERGLTEKDWKLMLSDIILATGNNMVPSIERFVKLPGISKEKKIKALSNSKRVIKLLKYAALKDPESKSGEAIAQIKKYLGSDAIEDILNESFLSFQTYNKLYL